MTSRSSFFSRAAIPLAMVLLLLPGCGEIRDVLRKNNEGVVAVRPLDEKLYGAPMDAAIADKSGYMRNIMLGTMAVDSATKCAIFQNGIGTSSRVTDGFFDVMTTTLAGLGAVFTPVSTVRALSASAAISSGTKTAIDANVFGFKTAPTIVGQINTHYKKGLDDLVVKTKLSADQWPAPFAAAEMISLHNTCSLDAALAAMNIELGKSQALDQMKTTVDQLTKIADSLAARTKPAAAPKASSTGTGN